jgi:hypothetical protein
MLAFTADEQVRDCPRRHPMGFEVFQKSSAPVSKVPTVTLQKRGLLSMNRAAHHLIGDAEFVELLWDADERVIGIRPAAPENPNAYPARPQSATAGKGPILIAGSIFTRHYDIDTTESRRWVVEALDGILCVDLNKEFQVATSNSGRSAGEGHDG